MYRILSTGKSGLAAFQQQLDLISDNIANTQTDGYRALETRFESLLSDEINNNGVPLSEPLKESGARLGVGTATGSTYRSEVQGALAAVEDPYSLAIQGEGYFAVLGQEGEKLLTRDGGFMLSVDNQLVDKNSNRLEVMYVNGRNQMPEDVEIADDGTLYGRDSDGDRYTIGQIRLYAPSAYSVTVENGKGLLLAEEIDVVDLEATETVIRQGYIEKSNVDIGQQLVEMLKTQRAYELNTQSLKTADDMWSLANNLRR